MWDTASRVRGELMGSFVSSNGYCSESRNRVLHRRSSVCFMGVLQRARC